jgi:hypothetical protein
MSIWRGVMRKLVIGVSLLSVWSVACASADDAASDGVIADEAAEEEKCPDDYLGFATGDKGLTVNVKDTELSVRLVDADHQPPKKDYNTWTVALLDQATGEPAADAVITWACAWMEVHDHGSNPKSVDVLGDNQYKLVDQNLSMFGPWELRLWIDPTGTEPVYAPRAGSAVLNTQACVPTSGPKGLHNTELKFCVPSAIAD